ncbi:ABC transporter ATP-binding protein [Flectobacillus sp. DC10W]|uniref:ABC transporter ATP-binding protein n=1 Tax=Flectobacillus longus TaxID=2984207 RepID=A0ABT6YLS8_9BACT|nr:ABC transporter ATP-binding protein [Flectobacillus longus]MDI9864540.1 ABC transporter ATP-binding protein [Flectobacillus longus]
MLIAKNIIKRYASLEVLKGIDLNITKGEVVSIVGASGAGKSTLLHILGTLDQPDSGSLIIDGQDVTQLGEKALATFRNEKIGFIFQFHNLLGEFSALENVCMPAFISGKGDKAIRERAEELLVMLGLKDRINNLPSQMSGGEQQRTAVARALMNAPAIIFADEPSGNLDSKNAQELHELFFTLRDKFQQTFVIVTHNEELANMADRKLVMQDGLIVN